MGAWDRHGILVQAHPFITGSQTIGAVPDYYDCRFRLVNYFYVLLYAAYVIPFPFQTETN